MNSNITFTKITKSIITIYAIYKTINYEYKDIYGFLNGITTLG
jgi:hypothetical protein